MSKLKEFMSTNWKRFQPSIYNCPHCKQPALEDTWPPNYGSGVGCADYTKESGSIKHVCKPCRLAFVVGYVKETRSGQVLQDSVSYYDEQPLVECGGFLLTPHDVWREDYKAEHGEYPTEAYA